MTMGTAWIALMAAGAAGLPGLAQAQEGAEKLPEVVAEGERINPPVSLGSGVDSGVSTIDRQDIELRTPGSGDVNQLLRILPTAQFTRQDGIASLDAIQDIRPANIAISGGRYYQNAFTLDGISVNSRLDVTNTNPQNGSELAGASAQTLWLDSELIGRIAVRDSNVSSEYGAFTGGSVAIETRDPRRTFGMTASVDYSEDALATFKMSGRTRRALEEAGVEAPAKPEFAKWRFGATVDLPLSADAALLVGYNRSTAQVVHYAGASYGRGERRYRSASDNLLVRGVYDIDAATKATAQVTYSPYSSQSGAEASIDNRVNSRGGGLAGKVGLAHKGALDWTADLSYSRSDTSRTAPPVQYNIPSNTTNGGFCTNASCTTGGIGDLDQTQDSYAFKGTLAGTLGIVRLRGGVDYEHVTARKTRPYDMLAYSRGTTGSRIVCADGNDMTCVTGEYALGQYNYSKAYDAKVDLDSVGLWGEASAEAGPLTVRGGLRYDYESFLGNHVVAPRFAAAWRLPWHDLELSVGANRYYGTSMVSYALRAHYPSLELYRRTGVSRGGSLVYSNAGWSLYSVSSGTGYSNSSLKTPYSDELTAALSGRVLGGTARLKGIYRDGRNDFVRSPMNTETVDNGDGTSSVRRYYALTNEGRSRYRGVSAEWSRSFGKQAVALSLNYSTTKRTNVDYFEDSDDQLFDPVPVLYQGEATTSAAIARMNRDADYAAPLLATATWSSAWLRDRLRSNMTVHYRNGFDRIEDSGVNQTIGGVRYDVYEQVHYADSVDVDLNLQADIVRTRQGMLTLDLRIANLLNSIPASDYSSTSSPWQYGRSFWVGLKYRL